MSVIQLDSHELRVLYDHTLRDALLTVSYAMRFYLHAADNARNVALRDMMLSSVDRTRSEIDKMAALVQELGQAPFHRAHLNDHAAREWVSLVDPADFSNRVCDLAIVGSAIAICKYLDARYTAMIEISGKLQSDTRLDGLEKSRDSIKASERALTAMQRSL